MKPDALAFMRRHDAQDSSGSSLSAELWSECEEGMASTADPDAFAQPSQISAQEARTSLLGSPWRNGSRLPETSPLTEETELGTMGGGRASPPSPLRRPGRSAAQLDGDTRFFRDGLRRVDFILAYTFDDEAEEERKKREKRREFEANLQMRGSSEANARFPLQLETEPAEESQDGRTCFVKIHAPWDTLAYKAEELRLKMPIRRNDTPKDTLTGAVERLLKSRWNLFELRSADIPPHQSFFSAPFAMEREEQFIMPSNKEDFFSTSQRARMVWDILIRTRYDRDLASRIGIGRLLKNGAYAAAFPLHERSLERSGGWLDRLCPDFITHRLRRRRRERGDLAERVSQEAGEAGEGSEEDGEGPGEPKNLRQVLYEHWAKPSRFFKNQPMDQIRVYFGEKIAMYFAWLAFYTKALIPAALIGILCVVYGLATKETDIPSREMCNETDGSVGSEWLCPACDHGCNFTKLNDNCLYAKWTHVFDNLMTVLFAVMMSIWATTFLEGWKRQHAEIAWQWDLTDLSQEEQPIRPHFMTRVKSRRQNPVTKLVEPYLPYSEKLLRVLGSAATVLFFLLLLGAFVFGVIVYRVAIVHILYSNQYGRDQANYITALTGACLNLVFIMIMGRVYTAVAYKLTVWEFPRTDSEFENSYTFKVFCFQFVNYYSSLFYIAFFKGKFIALPGAKDTTKLFGKWPPEQCNPAGCMNELLIQLAIIMVGKQLVNNAMEILFPIVWNWWRARSASAAAKEDKNPYTRWEKDYTLNPVPDMFLFDEYLEMVIQYGFVTLFVAAFPLAPLFALINNIMEVRLDAYKFVVAYRRPRPERVKDLGVWTLILDAISRFAVLTNACVIAFTTDFIPRLVYTLTPADGQTLHGFVDWTLSYYNVANYTGIALEYAKANNITYCRFRDFRKPPCSLNLTDLSHAECSRHYSRSFNWWHVLAAKLAFVLIFEHLVFFVTGMVSYFIPDVPHHITTQIQRENYLAKNARVQYELTAARTLSIARLVDLEGRLSRLADLSPTPVCSLPSSKSAQRGQNIVAMVRGNGEKIETPINVDDVYNTHDEDRLSHKVPPTPIPNSSFEETEDRIVMPGDESLGDISLLSELDKAVAEELLEAERAEGAAGAAGAGGGEALVDSEWDPLAPDEEIWVGEGEGSQGAVNGPQRDPLAFEEM